MNDEWMRECTYRTDGGDILLTDRLCEIENVNGGGGGVTEGRYG